MPERPVQLSTPEFYAAEEVLIDLHIPLIIEGKRTLDWLLEAINNPPAHYLT